MQSRVGETSAARKTLISMAIELRPMMAGEPIIRQREKSQDAPQTAKLMAISRSNFDMFAILRHGPIFNKGEASVKITGF